MDTFNYNYIDLTEIQNMKDLLKKHYVDTGTGADISINGNNFTVSGLNLNPIPLVLLIHTVPKSNLQTSAETIYSYTITTNAETQVKKYLRT